MQDDRTTRAQLVSELAKLRQRVTELEAAEAVRKQAEASVRFQAALVDSASDALVATDQDFNITVWNKAAESIYGWQAEQVIGQPIQKVLPAEFPQTREQAVEKQLVEKGFWSGELVERRKDGRVVNILASTSQLRDGVGKLIGAVTVNHDITERKQMETALRASQDRYRRIVETAREGIWILDVGGKTTFVNQRMTEMLGYMAGEMLSAPLFAFVDEKDYALAADLLERHRQSLSEQHEFRFRRRDGTDLWAILEASPILDEHGKPAGSLSLLTDITERKRAEEALRESEERFRRLYERAPLGYQSLDAEGCFIDVNQAWFDLLGYSRDQVIGRWFGDFLAPQEVEVFKQRFPHFKAAGEVHVDLEMVQRAGSTIIVHIDGRIGYDEHGQFKQTHCILTDITARKQAEARIAYQANLLAQVSDAIVASDEQYRLTAWNAAAEALYGWKAEEVLGRYGLEITCTEWADADADKMRCLIAETGQWRGEATQARRDGTRVPVEVASMVLCDETGRITGYVSVNRDITERKRAEEEIQSLARFPSENPNPVLRLDQDGIVLYANEASGALLQKWDCAVGGTAPEFWRNAVAEILASQSSQVIEVEFDQRVYSFFVAPVVGGGYVNLYGWDVTERKRAEEALQASEARYWELFNHMNSGVAVYEARADGADFVFTDFNQASERIDKVRKEDLIGKSVVQAFQGVKELGLFDVFQRVWKTGEPEHHPISLYKDERLVGWRENYVYKLPSGEIVAVYDDLTERKQAEQALQRAEQRYRALFEEAPAMYVVTRDVGGVPVIADCNALFCRTLGFGYDELTGRPLADFYSPASRDQMLDGGYRRALTGQFASERELVTRDGRIVSSVVRAMPEVDATGQVSGIRAMFVDITERKRAEEALLQANERLSFAQRSAGAGVWDWDMATERLYWSPEFFRLFGLDPTQVDASFGTWRNVLHPQDRQIAETRINEAIRDHIPLSNEYRIILPTGEVRWINTLGDTIHDEHGKAKRMSGICLDITDRKRAEEALRASEERYRGLFEHMAEGYAYCQMIFENGYARDFIYLAVNDAFETLTGLKDVTGKRVTQVTPGIRETDPELFDIYARVSLTGQPEKFEMFVEALQMWFSISVYSPEKEIFVSVFDVITERKQAEQALQCAEQRYRALFEEAPAMYVVTRDVEGVPVIADCNALFCRTLGFSYDELTGRPLADFYSPASRDQMLDGGYRRALTGQSASERELVTRDGRIVSSVVRTMPEVDATGQVSGIRAMFVDITERKRAESALRWAEERYRRLFEEAPLMYTITCNQGGVPIIADCNRAFLSALGYTRDEVVGRPLADLYTPESRAALLEDGYRRALEGSFAVEERGLVTCDGRVIETLLTALPETDAQGNVTGTRAMYVDITERKRAEEEVREKETLLNDVGKMARVGGWELDVETKEVHWTSETYRIHDIPEGEEFHLSKAVLFFDLPGRSTLEAALQRGMEKGEPFDLDLAFTSAKGRHLWTRALGRAVTADGKVVKLTGTFQDITERRRAEEALRESEKRYHIVSELTSDFAGAFRIALDGTIMREWLTGAYSRITGFNPGEMDTHGIWVTLVHLEDMRVALRHLQTLFSGQSDVCELRIVTASGEVRWLSNYGRPVWDEAQGRVIRIYSASQDITERKQAEERARREAARAKALARVAARLNAQLDLDTVLNTVCEETAHALGVPVASVMLYEPDSQVFRLAGIYGLPLKVCEQFTPVPQSLYEEYRKQKGSLFVIPDLQPSLPNLELYARYNIRTTVAAGMVRKDALVGALNIHTVGDVRTFDDEELALLQGLADQAAQALVNARLFDEVEQQHELLRTLAARLVETEEAERRRLARELHDRVGQSLTALSINLNIIRSQLPADSAQAAARLNDSLRLVEETVEHTRDVMADLRPPVLDDYGLLAALRWYAGQCSDALVVAVQVEGQELSPRLPPAVETALFRIAQEALNNVTRHAHATQANVRLEAVADTARLTIADDGVGFDPAARRPPGEPPLWGLINMRERAEAVGGRLRVESAPGQGTHVVVKVPR